MSRKRFTTMVVVVLLLGAAGLLSLYMTLGRMNAMLRAQGHDHAAAPAHEEKIEQMTLTPAGESQLRVEQEQARQSQGSAAGSPAEASGAAPNSSAAAPAPTKPASGSKTPDVPAKPAPASSTGAGGSAGR